MGASIHWTLVTGDGEREVAETEGGTLLEAIRRLADTPLPAPCAGRGQCGRCRVTLEGSVIPRPVESEIASLSAAERDNGVRLACRHPLESGMRVRLDSAGAARIEIRAMGYDDPVDSPLARSPLSLPPGTLEDQRSHAARVEGAMDLPVGTLPRYLASELTLGDLGNGDLSVVSWEGEPRALDPSSDTRLWTVAVDIGTTTVAAYLADVSTGTVVEIEAALNRQSPYGADVVSRLEHARKGPEEADALREAITGQLKTMIGDLLDRGGVAARDLHVLSVAGNTAMIHLLTGLDASGIGEAPFLPAALEIPPFFAGEIGIEGFPRLRVHPLPSLSAYVGADITGGILASGMNRREGTDLLLDIGTNGEMALGGKEGLVCCSTAAGPAFEGAHLSSGSGSVAGAVDHFDLVDGTLSYTTIDNAPAVGICGSGVVDFVAAALEAGAIDETGRIVEELGPNFAGPRLESGETGPEFVWDAPEAPGGTITFSQKDLREVQLAKAAIAAGVETLMNLDSTEPDSIGTVWLAGGFGSYIRSDSALAIGLLPRAFEGKVRSLGNAAARGALMTLFSRDHLSEAYRVARESRTVELSGREDFRNAYVEAMFFSTMEG